MSLTERPDGSDVPYDAEGAAAERLAAEARLAELGDEVAAAEQAYARAQPAGGGLVDELRAVGDAAVAEALGVLSGGPDGRRAYVAGPYGPQPEPVRVVIEVVAGLVPGGTPEPEFTRRWHITSREWCGLQAADQKRAPGELFGSAEALAQIAGRAHGYASLLMLQPERFNWVRVDWVWM